MPCKTTSRPTDLNALLITMHSLWSLPTGRCLKHLFSEKIFHHSVLCVFFSGQLAYWMETSPHPLNPHTPPPAPSLLLWLHPTSIIQKLAHWQEMRRDGGELEGKRSGVLVEEFRERNRIGCTYGERRGVAGRNRVVSEGLQLESVQEPPSWNNRR